jgi:hypothetical protein
MAWVFDKAPTTNPTDQLVLLAIADRCNDDGLEAWPSIETLAKKTRLSERGVWGALQRLRLAGVLRILGGRGRNRSNRYEVIMSEPTDLAPRATSHHVRPRVARGATSSRMSCEPDPAPRANDPSSTSTTPCTEKRHASELVFDSRFWPAYPRKTARKDALKAFIKIGPKPDLLEHMLAALEQQKASPAWRDPMFIPHAATWLNGARWGDELPVARPHIGRTGAPAAGKYAHLASGKDAHGLERES